MNLRYIFHEVNIYEGGAALKGWNSVPVFIKHISKYVYPNLFFTVKIWGSDRNIDTFVF